MKKFTRHESVSLIAYFPRALKNLVTMPIKKKFSQPLKITPNKPINLLSKLS